MNFKELPDMSAAYQEVQEKTKKLDPVGKEDGDINNDGKKDKNVDQDKNEGEMKRKFTDLPISEKTLKGLISNKKKKFITMTEIQRLSLPH